MFAASARRWSRDDADDGGECRRRRDRLAVELSWNASGVRREGDLDRPRQHVALRRVGEPGGIADRQVMRYQTLAAVWPVVGMVNDPLGRAGDRLHERVDVRVVMEVDLPREGAGGSDAVLGIGRRSGEGDDVAAAVERARGRLHDRRRRGLVRGDRQHRLVAGRGAKALRHDDAEARAVVRLGGRGDRVVLRRRAGDVGAVALPLVARVAPHPTRSR